MRVRWALIEQHLNHRLHVQCANCKNKVDLNVRDYQNSRFTDIADVVDQMRCSKCGKRNPRAWISYVMPRDG